MNLGEKAAFVAATIAVIVFTFTYLLARSRGRKRAEEAVVSFTVSGEGVTGVDGKRLDPAFLMTDEAYRVTGAASGYELSSIIIVVDGERFENRYVDEIRYHEDLALLGGALNVPSLDLHIGFQPDGARALYVWLSQEWSPLLLGKMDRLDDEAKAMVGEVLRSRLPDDRSTKFPASRLAALVASMEQAFGDEIEGSETLRAERDQMKALLALAGEGELALSNKGGLLAVLSRVGARSLHRRKEDGLTEVNLT